MRTTLALLLLALTGSQEPASDELEFESLVAQGYAAYEADDLPLSIECFERALEIKEYANTLALNIACCWAKLDSVDDSLAWLTTASKTFYGRVHGQLEELLDDPDLAQVRADPRFYDVLDGVEWHWYVGKDARFEGAVRRLEDERVDLAYRWLESAVLLDWGLLPENGRRLREDRVFAAMRGTSRFDSILERVDQRQAALRKAHETPFVRMGWDDGHQDQVFAVDVSNDGRRFVSAGQDRTARVWDLRTARPLSILRGHLGRIYDVQFDLSGERVVTASDDTFARVWDALTGELLTAIRTPGILRTASFSPDGRTVVTTEQQARTASVWDAATGAAIGAIGGHRSQTWSAEYSPDGTRIVTTTAGGDALVWDALSLELRTTLVTAPETYPGNVARSAHFSPDGQRIVLTVQREAAPGSGAPHSTVQVLDSTTGELLSERRAGANEYNWLESAFRPDGWSIVSGDEQGRWVLWDARTEAVISTVEAHPGAFCIDVAVSAAGGVAVSGGTDGAVRVWSLPSGRLLHELNTPPPPRTAMFSPDGTRLAVLSERERLEWSLDDGLRRDALARLATFGTGNDDRLTSWREPRTLDWSGASPAPLATLTVASGALHYPAPDLRRVVVLSREGSSAGTLLDPRTGEQIARLSYPSLGRPERWESWDTWHNMQHRVRFDPSGTFFVTVLHDDRTSRLWGGEDGALLATLDPNDAAGWELCASFSPTASALITGNQDRTASLWSVPSGELQRRLTVSAGVTAVAFDESGGLVATGGRNGEVRTWRADTGESLQQLAATGTPATWIEFSPDGSRLAVVHTDAVRVWSLAREEQLLALVSFESGGWIAATPPGFVNGSPDGLRTANVVRDGELLPLDSYASLLVAPDKIRRHVAGEDLPAPQLPPAPYLTLLGPSATGGVVNEPRVTVRAQAFRPRQRIEEVRVEINGVELSPEQVAPFLSRGDGVTDIRIPLDFTANPEPRKVKLRARNSAGIQSAELELELRYEPPPSELFLLALGVQEYDSAALRLNGPIPDADKVIEFFEGQQGLHYRQVHVQRLVDADVSVAALQRASVQFLGRAGPEDTVIVFVAGHGLSVKERFYFLTTTCTAEDPFDGVPQVVLEDLIASNSVAAQRRVLILDTCNAGLVGQEARGVGIVGEAISVDQFSAFEQRGKGAYVIAATGGEAGALEREGQGVFTRALLDALAGAADAPPVGNGNGRLEIEEVASHASSLVGVRTNQRQKPRLSSVRGGGNFVIALVPRGN
jgi:WD40 repeat protein